MAICMVTEPVLILDAKTARVLEANPSACALVRYSLAEVRRAADTEVLERVGLGDWMPTDGRPPNAEDAAERIWRDEESGEAVRWRMVASKRADDSVWVIVGCPIPPAPQRDANPLAVDLTHPLRMDPLTGLPDRAAFEQRLRECCQVKGESRPVEFAVLFIDLDGFKGVNDRLGHRHGDRLLRNVAQRLRCAIRPGDLVARFGGDEFTMLLDGVHAEPDAVGVAQRLLAMAEEEALASPGGEIVGMSVGIALGRAGMNPADLIDTADRAMYRAKAAGGGTWAVAEGASPLPLLPPDREEEQTR